jgi:hypothetical protein
MNALKTLTTFAVVATADTGETKELPAVQADTLYDAAMLAALRWSGEAITDGMCAPRRLEMKRLPLGAVRVTWADHEMRDETTITATKNG